MKYVCHHRNINVPMSVGYLVVKGDSERGNHDTIKTLLFETRAEAVNYIVDQANNYISCMDFTSMCVMCERGGDHSCKTSIKKKLAMWLLNTKEDLRIGLSIYWIKRLKFEAMYVRKTNAPLMTDPTNSVQTFRNIISYLEYIEQGNTDEKIYYSTPHPPNENDLQFDELSRSPGIAVKAKTELAAGMLLGLVSTIVDDSKDYMCEDTVLVEEFVNMWSRCMSKSLTPIPGQGSEVKIWTLVEVKEKL